MWASVAERRFPAPGGIDHFGTSLPFSSPPLPYPPLLLQVGPLEVGPLNLAWWSGERCNLASAVWGKAQPPTILVHFEDLETLLMTPKTCTVLSSMHVICPSMPIPASTQLTEFLYISCRKKLPHHPLLSPPMTSARGHIPAATGGL